MENKLHQVFHHQNSLKNFGCLIMLFILFLNLTSCKKKTSKSENSYSALKCFSGGINDKVKRVESTPDGGFLYCGVTGHDSSNYDAFLLKVDGKGNQEWYHTYGGPNYDEFNDAIPTSDGGYLAVGTTNSFGPSVSSGTYTRMDYEVKLNALGDTEWCRCMLPYNAIDIGMNSVMEGQDHYFYATGNWGAGYDVYLLKFDNTGKKKYFIPFNAFITYLPGIIGTTYLEIGAQLSQAADGSILIGGVMSPSSLSQEAFNYVTFFISANPANGAINFFYPYYNFRNSNYDNFDIVVKIIKLPDGYLIGTSRRQNASKLVMLLLKTDLNGNLVWNKQYEGLGNALLQEMTIEYDGAVLLIGSSTENNSNISKSVIIKTDKNGNQTGSFIFGGNYAINGFKNIYKMPSGHWSLAGWSSLLNSGFDKLYRIELDEHFNFIAQ